MKKTILLTVTGIMIASWGFAADRNVLSAVDAALDNASKAKKVPAAQIDPVQLGAETAPVWRSSLADIEKTSGSLVETNRKLAQEHNRLNDQLTAMEAAVTAQRQENERQLAAIEERRRIIDAPSAEGVFRQKIAKAGRDLQALQPQVSQAQARLKAVDNRIALRKLKIQELELEKKSLMLDRQSKSSSTLGVLKQSVQLLNDRVASQNEQIKYVQQKINELQSIDRPYLKEARQYEADNAKLKNDLAQLTAQGADLLKQLDAAVDKKGKAVGNNAKKLADLTARKQALQARITASQAKKEGLAAKVDEQTDSQAVKASELAAQIKDLETENKNIELALGNVRENIAVLEYRISTLTRYKNRNSTKN
ncbi:MAG: hypothetical protein HQL22_10035 [Candidatus Omnitrophica bacterium]|nr:hypothetical protein [Candidatus Omnitrophota bacterium]